MIDQKKKKDFGKHLDKIIMGAIIGGAVLSVIGVRRLAKKRQEEKQQNLFPLDAETAPKPKKKGFLRRLLGL